MKVPYIKKDRDRHGNQRLYVRLPGRPKIRIREKLGSEAFWAAYRAALAGEPLDPAAADRPPRIPRARPGSLRDLCRKYYGAPEFKGLAANTRRPRRGLLDAICQSKTGEGKIRGDLPWRRMRPINIRKIRDEHAARPEAANGRVKALRQVFAWAIEAEEAESNPAKEVPYLKSRSGGFHTWTAAELRQYQRRHAIGTKARLALELLSNTGTRRSDAVRLGRQMERAGRLHFTETKGNKAEKSIPILPGLRAVIDATPSGHLTYLVTAFGKPYSPAGFGNWFRRRCDEAGLPQCSAHGLRKAGATIAAENGATAWELMAIFGWESIKQAEGYTRKADQQRLADRAMHLLIPRDPEQQAPIRMIKDGSRD